VVVCDLDFVGITALPTETNSVLLVDTNTVLPRAIASEALQTVARRSLQFLECPDPV
jgi:hypothetical protein